MKRYITDILIFFFGILLLITYNYQTDLAPIERLNIIILVAFWFSLRLLSFCFKKSERLIVCILTLWGVIEAIWGLGQLYDILPSGHHIFKITGSFFNPGPYGGFVALFLPFSLHYWLFYRKVNTKVSYIFLIVITLSLLILPATLSRTAWISAVVGCTVVLFFQQETKTFWKRIRKKRFFVPLLGVIFFILIGGLFLGYHLKKDSANGRFFMWKISLLASEKSLLRGDGLGSFPKSYAEAQMEYFSQNVASEAEKRVAGSPEYAFNEYLRLLVEQGFWGLVIFLIISTLIIQKGIKNNQLGAVGAFISLSVFAFASYPYYLWQFLAIWVLLGALCLHSQEDIRKVTKQNYVLVVFLLIIPTSIISFCFFEKNKYLQAEKKWKSLQYLHKMKYYNQISEDYESLYRMLNYDPKFVFEYAILLNAIQEREKANDVLQRGLLISCDPMFYNLQGRNYHEMKDFTNAEMALKKSLSLLPKRIYPHYLLTKLYANSDNYQPEKMKESARNVLENKAKVHSVAIDEMRREVCSILKEKAP
ncbi:O-antigen ligase family protein [Capnocytophaga cynodegmi]|uniref:O-antigen polymerase n=1 Tax=Capnocytophaga cynodegmi TaxID=28189 RepID=A0A0B7HBT4_9FLAO|nr:O-antigen ligase family protein [Capnocytophaga cynodegmi]CEN36745.1 O-antigen polymerase [Capnocytophaga cynodegmi]